VWSEFGEANLFSRIAMRAPFVHDFSVATAETGSVWAHSWGSDLNLDFHKVTAGRGGEWLCKQRGTRLGLLQR
jgi:hypothetical protein